MKGEAKKIIDSIIAQRSKGDPTLMSLVRTKLILKGVNPGRFTAETDDDPAVIDKLRGIARELQVAL